VQARSLGRKEPADEGIWGKMGRSLRACTTRMKSLSRILQFAREGKLHTTLGPAPMFADASSGPLSQKNSPYDRECVAVERRQEFSYFVVINRSILDELNMVNMKFTKC